MLRSTVNNKVILAYSGHGLPGKSYGYYFSTYPIGFAHPETQGLSYDALETLLDRILPPRDLILLAACHSDEVDN